MRVPHEAPVLFPGQIDDLLQSHQLDVVVSRRNGAEAGDPPSLLLVGPADGVDRADARALRGGTDRHAAGVASCCAEVARTYRLEAPRDGSGGEATFRMDLPETVRAWLFDRALLWLFLSGSWGEPQSVAPASMAVPRRVDSSVLLDVDATERVWRCRLRLHGDRGGERDNGRDSERSTATGTFTWLVVERGDGARASRSLGRVLQRMREVFRAAGWPTAEVGLRRQDPRSLSGGTTLMHLDGGTRRVLWPVRAFRGIINALAHGRYVESGGVESGSVESGRDAGGDRIGSSLVLENAVMRLVDAELRCAGMLRLMYAHPRTARERRARHAVRTVGELIHAGGAARNNFIDTAYRSGALYRDATTLIRWLAPPDRDALRRGFGPRRWEQIVDHGRRRSGGGDDGVFSPWDRVATAAERLVMDLAQRIDRPGRRPAAATVSIVQRHYSEPRGARLRAAWRRHVDGGTLARALGEAWLSRLRRELPRVPREILILAAVGENREVQQRIAAVFSRRGQQLFREDVAAVEATITRDAFQDWDRLLAARRRLLATPVLRAGS